MPPLQKIKVLLVRKPLNMDHLFGYTLMNVTGEPVTPTKIAIFYLIRTLFHAHFGIRAVPSLKPFDRHEKTKVFTIIYGLLMLKSEISYDDFRRIVRILNDELGRGIYYRFVTSMEKVAHGDESIEMLFENAFYNSRRENHVKVRKRPEGSTLDSLTFLNKCSFVYIWMKRVMLQYTRTPQVGLFEFCRMMNKWIITGNSALASPTHFGLDLILPYEIDCSTRSRDWIADQLQRVQWCPSKAMPYSSLLDYCHLITKHHLDVVNVHLLMAVIHVQMKNPPEAVKCLKKFFDLSMLQVNEHTAKSIKTLVLMEPCQVALKYGPVLQGRVHRIFGDHEYADSLFAESIQQAQLNNEVLCNRIANLEVTINAILKSGPILEKPYAEETKTDQDRRVTQQTIHMGAEILPSHKSMRLDEDFHENFEMHTFLCSMSKMLLALNDMMDGRYFTYNRTALYVSVGLHRLRLVDDVRNKGRMIEDYANAIMTSGFIQNGMYAQARRVAEMMLVNNVEAECTPRMETESYAVISVNLVYSQAAAGDYAAAFETIRILEDTYPDDVNWMAARHIRICSHIVHFERDFLLNRYSACFRHLVGLESVAPLEYALRKSLLLAATGRLNEAVDILMAVKCGDVRGRIRIHMQLASIMTGYQRFESSTSQLDELGKLTLHASFRDANPLVSRRVGSLLLARFLPAQAFLVLVELRDNIEAFGSFIEKAIYYMSVARSLRLIEQDPRPYLKKCKLQVIGGRWPAMEKLILTELSLIHSPNGLFPDDLKCSRAKEQFGNIEMDFPGQCSWMLI